VNDYEMNAFHMESTQNIRPKGFKSDQERPAYCNMQLIFNKPEALYKYKKSLV